MAELATRRLIDAAATLPPADRALLSLWTQRGLGDEAMGRMTGVDAATIEQRRERIVAQLSETLGLPPEDVFAGLAAIAGSSAVAGAADGAATGPTVNGGREPELSSAEPAISARALPPAPGPDAEVEPAGDSPQPRSAPEETPAKPSPHGRRRRLLLAAAPLLLVVAVLAVIVSGSGGSGARSARSSTHGTAPPATTTASPPPGGASTGARTALSPLPGGDARARGSVTLTGSLLRVRVVGLPAAGPGHYEVYLYNSIVDSRPLGRLTAAGTESFSLPARASRYASIDISRQPPGMSEPSGVSVVRAPNPAHAG